MVNDVTAYTGITSPQQAVNSMFKRFLGDLCKKFLLFPYFLYFYGFKT